MSNPGDEAKFFTLQTIQLLERDLQSFEAVFANNQLRGKLGVALITSACAAMNAFAWLMYQKFGSPVSESSLFAQLIGDKRFFNDDFVDHKVLYQLVRCGVVHQFYAKEIGITVFDTSQVFGQVDGYVFVNALAFYRAALNGLRKIKDHVNRLHAPISELEDYDLKLKLRRKMDLEAADACSADLSKLLPFRLSEPAPESNG